MSDPYEAEAAIGTAAAEDRQFPHEKEPRRIPKELNDAFNEAVRATRAKTGDGRTSGS